jgi:hypothetical protein
MVAIQTRYPCTHVDAMARDGRQGDSLIRRVDLQLLDQGPFGVTVLDFPQPRTDRSAQSLSGQLRNFDCGRLSKARLKYSSSLNFFSKLVLPPS